MCLQGLVNGSDDQDVMPEVANVSNEDDAVSSSSEEDSVIGCNESLLDEKLDEVDDDAWDQQEAQCNEESGHHSDLKNDVASLAFMSVVESLFNDIFQNRCKKLTAENIDAFKNLIKGLLKCFEDWKFAQL